MAAPRERGWTFNLKFLPCLLVGCPARAGMDPCKAPRAIGIQRLPRASGDGP